MSATWSGSATASQPRLAAAALAHDRGENDPRIRRGRSPRGAARSTTTVTTRRTTGNRSFFTSGALSVTAVAARVTPSLTAMNGSSPQKRKSAKLSVRSPRSEMTEDAGEDEAEEQELPERLREGPQEPQGRTRVAGLEVAPDQLRE